MGSDGPRGFSEWATAYLTRATRDRYREARRLLESLVDRSTLVAARRAVRQNVELVALVLSFRQLDRKTDSRSLLARQIYEVASSPCRYLVAFLDHDGSARWLLVDALGEIDLADLVGAGDLLVPGVAEIRVQRPDGEPLAPGEHEGLEKEIEDDLRFDFAEDELAIEFHRAPGCLQAFLES